MLDEKRLVMIDWDILEYIRHVPEQGSPARIPLSDERVKSQPHASYLDYQEEGMQKAWKELRLALQHEWPTLPS